MINLPFGLVTLA